MSGRLLGRLAPPSGAGWLAASGLLLALAHPPFHLLLPSFLALVPFAVWVQRLPSGPEGRSAALRGGFFLGLIYFSLVFYWLLVALIFYTWLAILAFVLPVLILSGFLALATLGTHQAHRRLGWPVWLALPVFWTAMEWLRAHLNDVSFPWMGLGDTLTGFPWLIGAADVVGSRGLTFWLVAINGLIAGLWLTFTPSRGQGAEGVTAGGTLGERGPLLARRSSVLVALVLLLGVPTAYSLVRWNSLVLRPAARVVLVQPNIPEDLKLERTAAVDSTIRATDALLAEVLAGQDVAVDLVVLPETALPEYIGPIPSLGYPGRPDLIAWTTQWAERFGSPILFGGLGTDDLGGGEYDHFNSAFYFDVTGRPLGRYDKKYLVPIVERVPFVDPSWFRGLQYFGGFGVGRASPVFETRGARFGVLVCYESIFTQLSRHYRRTGADFLVNITNDAWFGREEPWWSRSSGLSQHPAHLVMRAIENRIGVARSANTGVTEFVDPLGRVEARTELFTHAVLTGDVKTSDSMTLYTRFGDVVGWAAAVIALLAAIFTAYRRPSDTP